MGTLLQLLAAGASAQKFVPDVLSNPIGHSGWFNSHLPQREVQRFQIPLKNDSSRVFLLNGYARYELLNPNDWLAIRQMVTPTSVTIVFTRQPVNIGDWKTNYYVLLANRIRELLRVDSSLNSRHIEWSLLLQTSESSTPGASLLPHGIVIGYTKKSQQLIGRREPLTLAPEPGNLIEGCQKRQRQAVAPNRLTDEELTVEFYPRSVSQHHVEHHKPAKKQKHKEPECPSFTTRAQKPKKNIFERIFR